MKALEFMSEFEAIKSMANCFGHLEGDFVKKDEFVFVNKKENSKEFQGKVCTFLLLQGLYNLFKVCFVFRKN